MTALSPFTKCIQVGPNRHRKGLGMEERFDYDGLLGVNSDLREQLADAQAAVEALQRERDEWRSNAVAQEARANDLERDCKDLQSDIEDERAKVKGLHEITKVICTHCCEPMEIPSKAVLQTQLTQIQALVRALPEMFGTITVEQISQTGTNWALFDAGGWLATVDGESTAKALKSLLQHRATLDATTPAVCPDCDGDGAVDSGGTDPNGNPLMRRCGCREKGGDVE